jgi:hypothetical protein
LRKNTQSNLPEIVLRAFLFLRAKNL